MTLSVLLTLITIFVLVYFVARPIINKHFATKEELHANDSHNKELIAQLEHRKQVLENLKEEEELTADTVDIEKELKQVNRSLQEQQQRLQQVKQ
jgi:hypothetical protein